MSTALMIEESSVSMEVFNLPLPSKHGIRPNTSQYITSKLRSEAIPAVEHGGLEYCEMLRIPQCVHNRLTDGGEVVSLEHRPHSTPQTYFLLLSLVLISDTD
jgi:hypothetical protein